MAEDDWMNSDANLPVSKFEDEDKPEEKKTVKVEEAKESKQKKRIDRLAEERQKKLVLSDAELKEIEKKYSDLPEKERIIKVQEETEKMLAKYVFSDVLKTSQQLATKEDFAQLAKSVAFTMLNSGKEYFIPTFFAELLNMCKADLDYEKIREIGDTAMRISNERHLEQKRKDEKKSKGGKASLKTGKGVADQKIMVKALVHQDNYDEVDEDDVYDEKTDFM
eukprot:TRINITY_DN7969_c0_g1_i6.p1 TRINITY_DN7969_c0_g1~~TRINITY_DN7969_c0_g1_i6.p1  ORF type:complete len:222 (+),score=121.70 TRINITY_DN7969_c0_g1_i6:174-839(+)